MAPTSRAGWGGIAAAASRSPGAFVARPAPSAEDSPGSSLAVCGDCRVPVEERGWNWLRASAVAVGWLKASHSGVEPASGSRRGGSATWPSRAAAIPQNPTRCSAPRARSRAVCDPVLRLPPLAFWRLCPIHAAPRRESWTAASSRSGGVGCGVEHRPHRHLDHGNRGRDAAFLRDGSGTRIHEAGGR